MSVVCKLPSLRRLLQQPQWAKIFHELKLPDRQKESKKPKRSSLLRRQRSLSSGFATSEWPGYQAFLRHSHSSK